jgi:hypothetical protein
MRRSRFAATAVAIVGLLAGLITVLGATPAQAADPGGGIYNEISPVRIFDSRTDDFQGPAECLPDGGRKVNITGSDLKHSTGKNNDGYVVTTSQKVPEGAAAVALNVTAADASASGWITVWPAVNNDNTDVAKPLISNLNYAPQQAIANMVIVRLDKNGDIKIAGQGGCPHGIIDLVGYYTAAAVDGLPNPVNGGFVPVVAPKRILDTRLANDGVENGQPAPLAPTGCAGATAKNVRVTNTGGVPSSGQRPVKAVVLNVTAVGASAPGFLTVYPGAAAPTASNVNYAKGTAVPNLVIAEVPDTGIIHIKADTGCPNVIVDVMGWVRGGDAAVTGTYTSQTPKRLLDTRNTPENDCVVDGTTKIPVAGVAAGGVPSLADPHPPLAVALNVTAVTPSAFGFLTVWDSGSPKPFTSNINYPNAGATPNMVIAKLGPDGAIRVSASAGCPQLIIDVVGWYIGQDLVETVTPSPIELTEGGTVSQVVTVKNNTDYNDPSKPVPTLEGADKAQFALSDDTCATSDPLEPTESCTFKVTWTPGNADPTANVKVTSGFGDTSVPLHAVVAA